jgi:hypothetical protein
VITINCRGAHGRIAEIFEYIFRNGAIFPRNNRNLTRLQSISDEHTVWYGLDGAAMAILEIMCPLTSLAPAIKPAKSAIRTEHMD